MVCKSLLYSLGYDLNMFKPSKYNLVDKNCLTFVHAAGMSPDRKGTNLLIGSLANLKGKFKLLLYSQINIFNYYRN